MLSIHEINLLEAQNEALKKQNRELQEELIAIKTDREKFKKKIIEILQEEVK